MSGKPRDVAEEGGESALTTVGSLMEERVRYEAWIRALNARRAETPKHVFTRVHADYAARLEAVVSRLSGQVEALRGELTTLATRIATLDEQQHRARDERAEAELRAHVGELSEEAYQDFVVQSDATLARLARQHAQASEALVRTREFLNDAEKPATPPLSSAPVPPVAVSAAPAPAPAAAAAASAAAASASAPARSEPKKWWEAPAAPAVPAAPVAPAASAAAAPAPSPAPPRHALTAEVKPRQTASVPTQGSPARLRPLPGREPPAPPPPPPAAVAPAPAHPTNPGNFDELAFLSSVVEEPGEEGSASVAGSASAPPAPGPRPPAAGAEPPRPTAPAPAPLPPRAPAPSSAPRPSVVARNPFAQRAQDKIENNDGAAGPKLESNRVGGRSPLGANVTGANPIVLRDKTVEAAKTLKCGECGAANYPTEWYCERCGAELASL